MDKEQYLSLQEQYLPEKLKLVFVLESPPASGLHGFKVKNGGIVVPFPSTGQQKKFHEEIGKVFRLE